MVLTGRDQKNSVNLIKNKEGKMLNFTCKDAKRMDSVAPKQESVVKQSYRNWSSPNLMEHAWIGFDFGIDFRRKLTAT